MISFTKRFGLFSTSRRRVKRSSSSSSSSSSSVKRSSVNHLTSNIYSILIDPPSPSDDDDYQRGGPSFLAFRRSTPNALRQDLTDLFYRTTQNTSSSSSSCLGPQDAALLVTALSKTNLCKTTTTLSSTSCCYSKVLHPFLSPLLSLAFTAAQTQLPQMDIRTLAAVATAHVNVFHRTRQGFSHNDNDNDSKIWHPTFHSDFVLALFNRLTQLVQQLLMRRSTSQTTTTTTASNKEKSPFFHVRALCAALTALQNVLPTKKEEHQQLSSGGGLLVDDDDKKKKKNKKKKKKKNTTTSSSPSLIQAALTQVTSPLFNQIDVLFSELANLLPTDDDDHILYPMANPTILSILVQFLAHINFYHTHFLHSIQQPLLYSIFLTTTTTKKTTHISSFLYRSLSTTARSVGSRLFTTTTTTTTLCATAQQTVTWLGNLASLYAAAQHDNTTNHDDPFYNMLWTTLVWGVLPRLYNAPPAQLTALPRALHTILHAKHVQTTTMTTTTTISSLQQGLCIVHPFCLHLAQRSRAARHTLTPMQLQRLCRGLVSLAELEERLERIPAPFADTLSRFLSGVHALLVVRDLARRGRSAHPAYLCFWMDTFQKWCQNTDATQRILKAIAQLVSSFPSSFLRDMSPSDIARLHRQPLGAGTNL